MKNLFFVAIMAAMISLSLTLTSCTKSSTDQLVEQQITVTAPEFFYVVRQTLKDGDTVWDRAKVYFGSGLKWTDVVAKNEFLQKPGRVWQNKTDGRWYVLIYPGEELIMGSTAVNPIFIDTIDKPNQEKNSSSTMGAWEILGIVCFSLLGLWFVVYLFTSLKRHGGCCGHPFHLIPIMEGRSIDDAMHQVELSEKHRIGLNAINAMIGKENLQTATIKWGMEDGEFNLTTDYKLANKK